VLGVFDVVKAVPLGTAVLSLSIDGPNEADQKESSSACGFHDGSVEGTEQKVRCLLYKYKSYKGVFEQGRVHTSIKTGGPLQSPVCCCLKELIVELNVLYVGSVCKWFQECNILPVI